ncbi:MAG: peptide ABC transporter substrate-binding protein [Wenzhouxiangella sp.]|nr:peptide ABC transporter substrate-binding protein [Wenzhouxiangella sp.]TVR94424.1 MAG: peptide ABC transporter substrate-binding protein [Wenzhouxiangellaceae bacterium]
MHNASPDIRPRRRREPRPCSTLARFGRWLMPLLLAWSMVSPCGAQTLHRGLGPEPDALDIHLAQSLSALNVLRDLHEGLVTFDARAELIPGVARDWQVSADGRTWTFELDPQARFSDNSPILAEHFVAGWERALDPVTASPTVGLLDVVVNARQRRLGLVEASAVGVRAHGPHRLEIELIEPVPWLPELLTHPVTFPWPGEPPRFSGPFKLVERVPGSHITLRANPHWREAGQLALAELRWHVIEEPNVELSRYRAGQLHITETIPPGRLDWLRRQFGDELRISPYLGSFFLVFNHRREPFANNLPLRQALSLVIDRELLTERVLGAGEVPAWQLVPPGMPGWPDTDPGHALSQEQRIAEARRLYRQAGYSERRPLRVELRFNTSLAHRRMAAAVAAMWREHLGVETRQVNEEWKVFVANRRQGRITQIVRGGWIADWRDAANFLQLFESDSPLNYSFWHDDVFDELMARARGQQGEQRLATLRLAEQRVLEQHVIIPLYYYVSRHLVHADVEGFEDNLMDIHLSRWLSLR